MIQLLIIRHAESIGNLKKLTDDNSDPKNDENILSTNGKLQAKKLIKELDKFNIDVIIVSQLKRTFKTIKPYLKKHKIRVIISSLTNERNSGIFAGKPQGSIREYCINNKIDIITFKPRKGESLIGVYKRAKRFLTYLNNHPSKTGGIQ